MKKRFLPFLAIVLSAFSLRAQLNMELLSQIDYNQDLSNIWGWTNPVDSVEYALVGLDDGLSIVSLADPRNAVEVQHIPGPASIWREIKTWKNHAYVTNETGSGLLIVDLSKLPNEAPYKYWSPFINDLGGQLNTIHSIFMDEFGTAYLNGSNLNSGGVIFADVNTDAENPIVTGWGPAIYCHDSYGRNNIMYAGEIYAGFASIYNVQDKTNPLHLASQRTPFSFTHNIWLSDDGKVMYTTDERANAPVAAYDISDLSNIKYLDEYRPIPTIGRDVIPHNVHVWNDWLLVSYYTDGGVVVDGSRPSNLIEVGNFDTFFGGGAGFNGVWGVYPYFPSQTVVLSDIGNGLYVLKPRYVRACWLEGTVTEAGTGTLLSGVKVEILSSQANLGNTGNDGKYASGQAVPGTFDVVYSKAGYKSKTLSATLENGVLMVLDVELEPNAKYAITGSVVSSRTDSPVENAVVQIFNAEFNFNLRTNVDGEFQIPEIFGGDYTIIGGAWGYHYANLTESINSNTAIAIKLDEGYQDDFALDYGWVATAAPGTGSGFWVRGEPIGTFSGGDPVNPEFDLPNDFGDQCYVTGNGGGGGGTDDVDDGLVRLTSPPMDLSNYKNATVKYSLWQVSTRGQGSPPNDTLKVFVSNGTDEVLIEWTARGNGAWRPQSSIELTNFLTLTDNMHIAFEISDYAGTGHQVEGAVDGFLVEGEIATDLDEVADVVEVKAFPNPFVEKFQLEMEVKSQTSTFPTITITNQLGQVVEYFTLQNQNDIRELGQKWTKGIYFLTANFGGDANRFYKIIKQ